MDFYKYLDIHQKMEPTCCRALLGQEALNTGAGRNMSASGQNPFSEDPNFVNISSFLYLLGK
jgi:hypothetical protein